MRSKVPFRKLLGANQIFAGVTLSGPGSLMLKAAVPILIVAPVPVSPLPEMINDAPYVPGVPPDVVTEPPSSGLADRESPIAGLATPTLIWPLVTVTPSAIVR
jgi:hypothetical protein